MIKRILYGLTELIKTIELNNDIPCDQDKKISVKEPSVNQNAFRFENYCRFESEKIIHQLNTQIDDIQLGKQNVLIFSDRLYDLAVTLGDYLEQKTAFNIIDITDEFREYRTDQIDLIIFTGYLQNESSYGIIKHIKDENPDLKTIMWARIDNLIVNHCYTYDIPYMFDRYRPLKDFLSYLKYVIQECI